jgi:hypothetical protein
MAAVWRHVAMVLLVAFTIATAIVLGEAYWGQADGVVSSVQAPASTRVASTSAPGQLAMDRARSIASQAHH